MIRKLLLSLALCMIIYSACMGSDSDSTSIANYLNQQLKYSQIRVSCEMLDSISSAELYCTKMNFQLNDGGSIPTSYDLIKTAAGFKPVCSSQELICCPEFIASIHKDFCLKDEKTALKFQEILDVVDRWNNMNSDRAFFKIDNSWYFIRDKFFDDYEYFKVETNKKGQLLAISYLKDKMSFGIPEDKVKSNSHRAEWGYIAPAVSTADSAYLRSYFDEQTNFHFEFSQLESRLIEKLTTAQFYTAKIVFTEEGSSSATIFNLLMTPDTIVHANSNRELLEQATFKEALREDFFLKSKEDALTIEEALDIIVPVGSTDAQYKDLIQQEGKWYFVRSEFFGDKSAYIAETNENGKITAFTYNMKAIKKQ